MTWALRAAQLARGMLKADEGRIARGASELRDSDDRLTECQEGDTSRPRLDWSTLGARIRRDAMVAAAVHAALSAGDEIGDGMVRCDPPTMAEQ